MAQRVYLETVKPGLTAIDRRVVYAASSAGSFTTTDNLNDPVASSEGVVTQGVEALHILFDFAPNTPGADSVDVQIWWWSSITGTWHAGESPTYSITESTVFTVENLGLERMYIQLANPVGTFTMSVWAARIIPT